MAANIYPVQDILNRLLPGVKQVDFCIELDQRPALRLENFDWEINQARDGGETIFSGVRSDLRARWVFSPFEQGFWVRLEVEAGTALGCKSLTGLALDYHPPNCEGHPAQGLTEMRIPTIGMSPFNVGLHRLEALTDFERTGTLLRGAFSDSHTPGLFLGTRLPQNHVHLYSVGTAGDGIRFSATTHFQQGLMTAPRLVSETTWVSSNFNLSRALAAYADHVPVRALAAPPVGWSSWDYYSFSVSLDDIIENMDAIRSDLALSQSICYIGIDEGWEHMNGEWQPNYKFPGGMQRAAQEIHQRGFIPGVWTAPTLVNQWSKTALRDYDMLLTDQYGDPIRSGEHYILDPTHPKVERLLRELYTGLYRAGFRFFKVDFVDQILSALRFHDPSVGPYEVLRRLFALIRACVGAESHIMGCSLPFECGPGVADSGRTGIDIHNQWTHIEWAVDTLQLVSWAHSRLWVNDPDYLVVRGQDTSLEAETYVLNPQAHNPNPPRWRRGPVFNALEAQTWATIVSLSGGSVFLSDRISKLNQAGKHLLSRVIQPTGVAAHPLDLGDGERASLWLADLGREMRLGVINWQADPVTRQISFAEWSLGSTDRLLEFWSGHIYSVQDGAVSITLPAHGSLILTWKSNA
jgi:hypothetical protein